MIRREMEEKLEAGFPLYTVRIPVNQIEWEKKGKEIHLQGKMFDIKTQVIKNGVATFTGLFDEDETALKNKLNENCDRKSAGNNQLLIHFLQSLKGLSIVYVEGNLYSCLLTPHVSLFLTPTLPFRDQTVLTPPPQSSPGLIYKLS